MPILARTAVSHFGTVDYREVTNGVRHRTEASDEDHWRLIVSND